MFQTLISPPELRSLAGDPNCVVVDCRFALGKPTAGRLAYLESHLPGARYADLEKDLSGPVRTGTGRHPLPDKNQLVDVVVGLGIGFDSQVVAYDDGPGHMAAARLWWLLKWAGHEAVAVLDGGLAAWRQHGYELDTKLPDRVEGSFVPHFKDELLATASQLAEPRHRDLLTVADSRAPDRFRGENETIDPVAGHIPGAVNLPFAGNTGPGGCFLTKEQLRIRFELLGEGEPTSVVFYCGSGVTAAHNVLAYRHAGLGMPRLYPGSWSEWITDPDRPVETGEPS